MQPPSSDADRLAPFPFALSLSILVSLALHLEGASAGRPWQVFLFKPLTTILILVMAWRSGRTPRSVAERRYARWIEAGLACSLAGDAWLMLPRDFFVAGLVSFLLAHACYIGAFAGRAETLRPRPSALPYALAYVLLVGVLAPHAGPMIGAVSMYGVAVVVMAWSALAAWQARPSVATAGAAAGGVLFVASDALLAAARFIGPFAHEEIAVAATYVAAQWLIARSV